MKFHTVILLSLLPLTTFGEEMSQECLEVSKKFENLVDTVYRPNVGLLKDAGRSTTFSYEDRLEKAFHATKKEDLEALFKGPNRIAYKDIEQLYDLIKAGVIKTKPEIEKFVDEFYMFLQDKQEILQGDKDQVYNLLKAFQKRDADSGYSAARTDAAISTEAGMLMAEKNLLKQAVAETKGEKNPTSKWFDGLANFFSPHNKRMQNLLNANNQLRKKMQTSYASVEPVDDALEKYASMLSPDRASKLKDLIESTGTDTAEVRETIEAMYGKQLTQIDPIKVGDIRLSTLGKKIKEQKAPSNLQIEEGAEDRLDVLDKVIAETRKEHNQPVRPMSEYHPRHLEIRNTQYARETGQMAGRYSSHVAQTAPKSTYVVEVEWTVDVKCSKQVPKPGAKNGETETESWNDSYTTTEKLSLDASYDEVLEGKISPDIERIRNSLPSRGTNGIKDADYATNNTLSAKIIWTDTSRTSEILSRAKKAREVEKPLRNQLDQSIDQVGTIREDYQQLRKTEAGRKKAIATLKEVKESLQSKVNSTLDQYAKLSDADIRKLWPDEEITEFRARNELQLARFLHLVKRVDHFSEQIGRNVDNLELNFSLPDHSEPMNYLDSVASRNFKIQVGTVSTVATGTAGYYGYKYIEEQKKLEKERGSYTNHNPYTPTYSPEEVEASKARLERMSALAKTYEKEAPAELAPPPPPPQKKKPTKKVEKKKVETATPGGLNE